MFFMMTAYLLKEKVLTDATCLFWAAIGDIILVEIILSFLR
jgi:hypothetical protein